MNRKPARKRPNKAPTGREKIAQGSALGSNQTTKDSPRGLEARACQLAFPIWAVLTSTRAVMELTHEEAWLIAISLRDNGEGLAVVITNAAATRAVLNSDRMNRPLRVTVGNRWPLTSDN